jgi:hypothetical protein
MVPQKDFYLLEPFHSYPAPDAKQWLGRVVSDFRRPVSAYTPRTSFSFPLEHGDDPNFSNVAAVLDAISSDAIRLSLLDVFGIKNEDSKSNKYTFKTRKVQRLRVHNDAALLEKVLKETDVMADLEKWQFSIFTLCI